MRRVGRRGAGTALGATERAELEAHRALAREVSQALRAAGEGDPEARVPRVPEAEAHAGLVGLRHAVNRVLDLSDAFVRESGAALAAAGEGRFHRRLVERGMPGHYRVGAEAINAGQATMAEADRALRREEERRRELADRFEDEVVRLSGRVVDASQQIAGATDRLSTSAQGADAQMDQARSTVESLSESSGQIHQVVRLIDEIAAQTRLLALNAAIEAARVGEAGRGFAVVAKEIRDLANQTQAATQQVGQQVTAIQAATGEAVAVIQDARVTVHSMNEAVSSMASAVTGSEGGPAAPGAPDARETGLVPTTAALRRQVDRFLDAMRR